MAITRDGKATAVVVKDDRAARVARLKDKGITPGPGTVLVGDDPGSHAYVGGKHPGRTMREPGPKTGVRSTGPKNRGLAKTSKRVDGSVRLGLSIAGRNF